MYCTSISANKYMSSNKRSKWSEQKVIREESENKIDCREKVTLGELKEHERQSLELS